MRYQRSSLFISGLYILLSLPTSLSAQTDDPHALQQFHAACIADKSPLWGVNLWGPLILVDPNTRSAIANQPDPDGKFESRDSLFYGTLPSQFTSSNTSIDWGGHQWAMVMLPLPASRFARIRLLAHESFHRLQKQLNLTALDQKNEHLATETGRVWMRMELRALARALRNNGDRASVQDALAFRAIRQKLFPDAKVQEAALEIQEGLPEYTGTVLALKDSGESIDRVARATEDFEDQSSFLRSFAYATGPALGLLLDRYQPDWRKSVTASTGLAGLLSAAVGTRTGDRRDLYGYQSVAEDEHEREARHQLQLAKFRTLFLDGPTLQFPKTDELYRSFNPCNLVSMGDLGTVYPTGTFTARWGKLQVQDVGALLSPDNQSLRVVAPQDAAARTGPGWKLELNAGWTIRPAARSGDFELAPMPLVP
ncbi:MAG TPA: hypothetical protein VK752_19980 [Bryobacteraceae bacterium]|jgi:hypothetical protein|nr:hypothetical protein [Bryobacteraceae bacterium]